MSARDVVDAAKEAEDMGRNSYWADVKHPPFPFSI
jgi:hypothetical protein